MVLFEHFSINTFATLFTFCWVLLFSVIYKTHSLIKFVIILTWKIVIINFVFCLHSMKCKLIKFGKLFQNACVFESLQLGCFWMMVDRPFVFWFLYNAIRSCENNKSSCFVHFVLNVSLKSVIVAWLQKCTRLLRGFFC